jgi:hypothetical protein
MTAAYVARTRVSVSTVSASSIGMARTRISGFGMTPRLLLRRQEEREAQDH